MVDCLSVLVIIKYKLILSKRRCLRLLWLDGRFLYSAFLMEQRLKNTGSPGLATKKSLGLTSTDWAWPENGARLLKQFQFFRRELQIIKRGHTVNFVILEFNFEKLVGAEYDAAHREMKTGSRLASRQFLPKIKVIKLRAANAQRQRMNDCNFPVMILSCSQKWDHIQSIP